MNHHKTIPLSASQLVKSFFAFIVIFCWYSSNIVAQPIIKRQSIVSEEFGNQYVVASQHPIASKIGARIIAKGGNAADATVAVGLVLAVVLPRAGNIAGGGLLLYYDNQTKAVNMLDFREKAPNAAHADMFDHPNAKQASRMSKFTGKAVGVPGTIAGLYELWQKHGSLPWHKLVAPAIVLAKKGFYVTWDTHHNLINGKRLLADPTAKKTFFPNGKPLAAGTLFKQPDLAKTLSRIAKAPLQDFYTGKTAKLLINAVANAGGIMTLEDLQQYKAVWRTPIKGTYRGNVVYAATTPSSGGIHLVQMLNILENFNLAKMGYGSAEYMHVLIETMKRAYADRSKHLGDADFYPVPTDWLTSKAYAKQLSSEIDLGKSTDSNTLSVHTAPKESLETTHFSIVDKAGNVVSLTYTINFSFGSGIMVPGGGFFLNNEMDDFSKAGVINAYGLVGSHANRVQANKRPLSSMTPTIVIQPDASVLATGAPGGSRIITAVLQLLINKIDFNMTLAEATIVPRLHHQFQPDMVFMEKGFSPDSISLLQRKGHAIKTVGTLASLISTESFTDTVQGFADPRRPDGTVVTDTRK